MDVYRAIRTLYEEKKRLDKLIESLEALQAREDGAQVRKERARRGRKRMSAEERRQVSERMKKYWAARREQASAVPAQAPEQALAATADSGSGAEI